MSQLPFDGKSVAELDVDNPKPGVYLNVPIGTYVKINALSRSKIADFIKDPIFFTKPKQVTKAMIFGSQYHAFLLEEELFKKEFRLGPERRQSKADKAWYKELEKEVGREMIYSPTDLIMFANMREALMRDFPECYTLLVNDQPSELTVIYFDPEYEMLIKVRLDRAILEWGIIADLKTMSEEPTEKAVKYYIYKYSVDLQAELYLRACENTPGLESLKIFTAVFQHKGARKEEDRPYNIHFADHWDLAEFRGGAQVSLARYMPQIKEFIKGGYKIPRKGIKRLAVFGDE